MIVRFALRPAQKIFENSLLHMSNKTLLAGKDI